MAQRGGRLGTIGAGRGSAGFATIGGALVVGLVTTALVVGAPVKRAVVDVLDGNAWLVDVVDGEVLLANGSSAQVDLRLAIEGAAGHDLEVVRVDGVTLLVDRSTGEISRLDVANLGVGDPSPLPGDAASVDLLPVGSHLVMVDRPAGVVELQDPSSLEVLDSVEVGGALTRAVADDEGTVWVVDLDAGEAVPLAVEGDALDRGEAVDVSAHRGGQLAAVDGAPALVDVQRAELTRFRRGGAERPVGLPLRDGEAPAVPRVSEDGLLPLAANDSGDLVVVDEDDEARRIPLDRAGHDLGEPVTFDGRIYVPDFSNGTVVVVARDGTVAQAPIWLGDGGRFSLRVEGQRLWVDDPTGDTAFVVDRGSQDFRAIDKGRADVPSNLDPPAAVGPPANPQPRPEPASAPGPAAPAAPAGDPGPTPTSTIPPSPPGAPGGVDPTPGDESAVVSWGPAAPNGAPIDRYTVTWTAAGDGDGGRETVPGDRLQLTVDGLDNGTQYVFRVSARNPAGTGPEAVSDPVVPDGEVPDPPDGVTATANGDGTVAVSWDAADPNGPSPVADYDVTAEGDDTSVDRVATGVTGLSATVGEGDGLLLGTGYRFTVTATNRAGVASAPSDASDAVVPYRPAGAPAGLDGTGTDQAIEATWQAPALNGGTLVGYDVTVTGGAATVHDDRQTGTTLEVGGLANGTDYTVTVAAVTEVDGTEIAGEPATSDAIRPGRAPAPSGMTATADDRTLSWSFTVDENDSGPATCTVYANGDVVWGPQACSGTMSDSFQGGNGVTYTVYAVAENDYGEQESNEANARTSDPPEVVIAKGGTYYHPDECWDDSCAHIRVTLRNFTPNSTVRVQCHETNESGFATVDVTVDSNGGAVDEPCFFGYQGREVWVTAGTATSDRLTW